MDPERTTTKAWIRLIGLAEAEGRLRTTYERIAGPDGHVDRVLQLHGLRPHTLDGHLALYKATLHHAGNRLPRWWLELIGVAVSGWNGCAYCVAHHGVGLVRLLGDALAAALIGAAERGPDALAESAAAHLDALGGAATTPAALAASLAYARALTVDPATVDAGAVDAMRAAGLSDGEVLEVNQVVAYFAYVNRAVLGLGVSHEGETLGLAPSNVADEGDVRHR
jgi:uncharacterized peroxidase-related enzyme